MRESLPQSGEILALKDAKQLAKKLVFLLFHLRHYSELCFYRTLLMRKIKKFLLQLGFYFAKSV